MNRDDVMGCLVCIVCCSLTTPSSSSLSSIGPDDVKGVGPVLAVPIDTAWGRQYRPSSGSITHDDDDDEDDFDEEDDDDKKWLSKEQSQPAVGPRWIANSQNVHTTCHHHHYFHNNHHSDDDAQDKRCQAEAFKTVWRASALHNPLDRPRHDDDDDDGDDDDDDTNYDNDDDTLGGRNPPWRGLSWTSSPDVFSPTTQFSNGPTLLMLRNVLF